MNGEVVPTVWGVNYSGEGRRPAAGGRGGEGGGNHTCFLDLMAASSRVSAASNFPCRL